MRIFMKKRCSKCGNELDGAQQFCSNCGTEVISMGTKNVKKPPTLVKKLLFYIVILAILIVVSGHFYLKKSTSPTSSVQRMYNALMNEDADSFYNELTYSNSDATDRIEFMNYIMEQDMETFLDMLIDNAQTVHEDGITVIISHEDGHALFRMKQGKKLGIYPTVQVEKIDGVTEEEKSSKDGIHVGKEMKINNKGKTLVPVDKLASEAIYTTTLQNGNSTAKLYVLPLDASKEVVEFSSAFGIEGDQQYEGTFAFYLAEVDGENGVLQEALSISAENIVINLHEERFPFKEYTFGEQTIVSLAQIESSNSSYLNMWLYAEGELKEIQIEDGLYLGTSTRNLKFIGNNYMQSYTYFNGMVDSDEGVGWTFSTWKWNPQNYRFSEYTTESFTDNEDFGWETGEQLIQHWNDYEQYYVPFPELTFTKKTKKLAMNGMLMKDSIRIGIPIDKVLKKYPDYMWTDYYEGGEFYAYPGGFSYFYDEITRGVSYIILDGRSLTNELGELEDILGKSIDSGYDDYEEVYYQTYLLGDYTLKVTSTESDEILSIWYHLTKE